MGITWDKIDPDLHDAMDAYWSRCANARGNDPSAIYVIHRRSGKRFTHVAIQYLEPGKWERWMIRRAHRDDQIRETWSHMMDLLRPLIGDRAAIEVYPRECDTVDTAHVRHFWILPDGLRPEFDLRTEGESDA